MLHCFVVLHRAWHARPRVSHHLHNWHRPLRHIVKPKVAATIVCVVIGGDAANVPAAVPPSEIVAPTPNGGGYPSLGFVPLGPGLFVSAPPLIDTLPELEMPPQDLALRDIVPAESDILDFKHNDNNVPEPTSILLFATALFLFLGLRAVR